MCVYVVLCMCVGCVCVWFVAMCMCGLGCVFLYVCVDVCTCLYMCVCLCVSDMIIGRTGRCRNYWTVEEQRKRMKNWFYGCLTLLLHNRQKYMLSHC